MSPISGQRASSGLRDSFVGAIDRATGWLESLLAAIACCLVGLVCYDVVARYLFSAGSVALQELEWHLFGLIFLLGVGPALRAGRHVAIDILYQSGLLPPGWRHALYRIGLVVLLIPFAALLVVSSLPFVEIAWRFDEGSPDPGGLNNRWLLKAAIPVGYGWLILQAVAEFLRLAHSEDVA